MKNVLLLKAGETSSPLVKARHGDYDDWFKRTLEPSGHRLHVVAAYIDEALPDPARFDSILMTGSPATATRLEEWMVRSGDYMLEAAARGVPVLGVCFGHQLLGRLLGGIVAHAVNGREMGTVRITLTPEGRGDPLFEGVDDIFEVQTTHGDIVESLPSSATLLAGNDHTEIQAFGWGPRLRAVQFHPEADAPTMRDMIDARAAELRTDAQRLGHDPEEYLRAVREGVRPAPAGARILENFLRHFS